MPPIALMNSVNISPSNSERRARTRNPFDLDRLWAALEEAK
ncbi:hypothetical protein ACQP0C_18115 [Nocardia sp. CA-129566]